MSGSIAMFPAPTLVPQFFDNNGLMLESGLLFCYQAGTVTKQACFTDSSGATPLPNPIVLNARGEVSPDGSTSCGLWMTPTLAYKFVLAPEGDTDPPSNPIWTVDNVVSAEYATLNAPAIAAGVPIGSQMVYGAYATDTSALPPGWLLCDGSDVSRTTYALLFAKISTNYGPGDGSTTFTLPDKRGRVSVGADNMGGAEANRVTFAGSGIASTTIGQGGGSELTQTHTHGLTLDDLSLTINDPGHVHQQYFTGDFPGAGVPEGGVSNALGPGTRSPDMQTASATTGITINTATNTGTVEPYGSGGSQNMIPCQIDYWIIFAGA